jgi:hypothetical protein
MWSKIPWKEKGNKGLNVNPWPRSKMGKGRRKGREKVEEKDGKGEENEEGKGEGEGTR